MIWDWGGSDGGSSDFNSDFNFLSAHAAPAPFAYNSIIIFLNSSVLAPGPHANDAPANDAIFFCCPCSLPPPPSLTVQCHFVVQMS